MGLTYPKLAADAAYDSHHNSPKLRSCESLNFKKFCLDHQGKRRMQDNDEAFDIV